MKKGEKGVGSVVEEREVKGGGRGSVQFNESRAQFFCYGVFMK